MNGENKTGHDRHDYKHVMKGSLFSLLYKGPWQAYIMLGGIKMEYASWKLSNSVEKF